MLQQLPLLGRTLDLDAAWVDALQFEMISDEELKASPESEREPGWQSCLAWISGLVKAALDSGATALHVFRDREDGCQRQLMLVPNAAVPGKYEWLEFVPMPWSARNAAIRAVRTIALMWPWRQQGVIRYRYRGKHARARCVRESADSLMIYLAVGRPASQMGKKDGKKSSA